MVTGIILAAAAVGIPSILIGVLLGVASEKFKVQVDEKETLVRNELPGNNYGGCGYAGCDVLAETTAASQADVGACPVGGAPIAERVGETIGVTSGTTGEKVAFVKYVRTCGKTKVQCNYYGVDDCRKVSAVPGAGKKACTCGCMDYGSCVKACAFDAIHVVDGAAVVDKERYVVRSICVALCPNHLIELAPYKAGHLVGCSSHDKGKDVKAIYAIGHIGCTLCTKQYEFDAIRMKSSLAVIDYEKCISCGKCVEKCPVKAIA